MKVEICTFNKVTLIKKKLNFNHKGNLKKGHNNDVYVRHNIPLSCLSGTGIPRMLDLVVLSNASLIRYISPTYDTNFELA